MAVLAAALPAAPTRSATPYVGQAERLTARHGVQVAFADQPLLFLRTVLSAMPDDQVVGLVAATCYQQVNTWHSTETPDWTLAGEILRGRYSFEWARRMNSRAWSLPGLGSIYWQGASRQRQVLSRFGARGGVNELVFATAFWADLDCAKHNYSLERGLEALLGMPLKPTFVVFSGGGLQPVHVLADAWPVTNRAAALEYKSYSLALYRQAFESTGLALDTSVHEASRMMRLPGFANRKPERQGAVARIVYHDPKAIYTIQTIKARVELPPARPRLALPMPPPGDGLYQVSQEFVQRLIDDPAALPTERHPALLALSLDAARAGIPEAVYLERLRPVAEKWFAATGESHRADPGDELDRLVGWSYERIAEDLTAMPTGTYLVRLAESGFERAAEDEQEKTRLPIKVESEIPLPQAAPALSLAAVRAEQQQVIRDYIYGKNRRGLGTYLLLLAPPGVGKTQQVYQAAQDYARAQKASSQVAILTLFKFDEKDWRTYVGQFGVDPRLCFYLVARNGDPKSAGYCALSGQADGVARKNWNVVQTLCSRCPHQQKCRDGWYLSQFTRAAAKPILLARHHHGHIQEVIGTRKLVIFDESPLQVVASPVILSPADLVFSGGPVFVQDQYPDELALVGRFVETLRGIVAANPKPEGHNYPTRDHVRLGGRWLLDRLTTELSKEVLARFVALDEKLVKNAAKVGIADLSPEAVAALPTNYLLDLWRIVRYEYRTHFQPGRKAWNSRLVAVGSTLHMYEMEPFDFAQGVKVIITDATGQPELYGKALAYQASKVEHPRVGHVYEAKLEPRAQVVQFVGTDNSKTKMRRVRKSKPKKNLEIQALSPIGERVTLDLDLDSEESAAIEQSKALIAALAEKHKRSLLVVCYKEMVQARLLTWAKEKDVLAVEQIQWFGNLRGRNDYQHLEAVLVIGTPRIQAMDLLVLAQAWHWQDELPVGDERLVRDLPYMGYVDPTDGKGRAHRYVGYQDERVNELYIHLVQAEIRQCAERIRPNTSDKPRFVYLATAFPAADHVDELQSWSTWWVDHVAREIVETRIKNGMLFPENEMVNLLVTRTKCSKDTARAACRRVLPLLSNTELVARSQMRPGERVLRWLEADPARRAWTVARTCAALGVSEGTVKRYRTLFDHRIK